jgi:hypothetical protein
VKVGKKIYFSRGIWELGIIVSPEWKPSYRLYQKEIVNNAVIKMEEGPP